MHALNVVFSLNRSLSTKVRTVFLSLKVSQKNFFKSKHTTSFGKKLETNDVVLFQYENPKFFLLLNVISGVQCAFWTYLGYFLHQSVKASESDVKRKKFWGSVLEKDGKSNTLSAVALFCGWSVFLGTCLYSLRSIRKVIFHRNRRLLTVITYNLPGRNVIEIPLSDVSSQEHRLKAKKFIPIKLKNKLFYYLLDVRGEFPDPELFDFTAGVNRNF